RMAGRGADATRRIALAIDRGGAAVGQAINAQNAAADRGRAAVGTVAGQAQGPCSGLDDGQGAVSTCRSGSVVVRPVVDLAVESAGRCLVDGQDGVGL